MQDGGVGSLPTQAPRSNSMYRSTFSCAVSVAVQWFGNVEVANGELPPPVAATWKPLYATPPQLALAGAPKGVLNENCCTRPLPPLRNTNSSEPKPGLATVARLIAMLRGSVI